MTGCLGEVAAALVDGALDHAERERALSHLAHCAACRAEVDEQRRLKARLAALPAPAPDAALTARLRALAGPDVAATPLPGAAPRPTGRPVSVRPPARAGRGRRPGAGTTAGRVRRRAAAGSALAALGVAAALALGSPPSRPPSTPVDPGTDAFVTEFVDTTNAGTVPEGTGASQASLTTGGAGSRR